MMVSAVASLSFKGHGRRPRIAGLLAANVRLRPDGPYNRTRSVLSVRHRRRFLGDRPCKAAYVSTCSTTWEFDWPSAATPSACASCASRATLRSSSWIGAVSDNRNPLVSCAQPKAECWVKWEEDLSPVGTTEVLRHALQLRIVGITPAQVRECSHLLLRQRQPGSPR